jgi:hydroxylamine reductase
MEEQNLSGEASTVTTRPLLGPAILVRGHDMVDLIEILQQTKDKGINVYTMTRLPRIEEIQAFEGNIGEAWHNQGNDFSRFKTAIP